jgi:hypothetical protein
VRPDDEQAVVLMNIGRYRSPAAFTAALADPEFPGGRIRHPACAAGRMPYQSSPALYRVIRNGA